MLVRTIDLETVELIVTPILSGSQLVRFRFNNQPTYDGLVIATPMESERILHLSGHLTKSRTLTLGEWVLAQNALFPKAEQVVFERLQSGGTFSHKRLSVRR